MESFELTAQVMRFQPGVADIRRHAPQGGFEVGLERGIFCNQATERPLKPGRENEFAHRSLNLAQTSDDSFRGLGFQFAQAKGRGGFSAFGGRFRAPGFDAAFPQQIFQHPMFFREQTPGVGQDFIQCERGHRLQVL